MKNILFVIWSEEHKAWWRPNSRGYTTNIDEAGHYSLEEANAICTNAADWSDPSSPPPESMLVAPEFRKEL